MLVIGTSFPFLLFLEALAVHWRIYLHRSHIPNDSCITRSWSLEIQIHDTIVITSWIQKMNQIRRQAVPSSQQRLCVVRKGIEIATATYNFLLNQAFLQNVGDTGHTIVIPDNNAGISIHRIRLTCTQVKTKTNTWKNIKPEEYMMLCWLTFNDSHSKLANIHPPQKKKKKKFMGGGVGGLGLFQTFLSLKMCQSSNWYRSQNLSVGYHHAKFKGPL